MALVKTQKEIEIMRQGGALLSRALQAAVDATKPGVPMKDIDAIAEQVIIDGGGRPSFKNYKEGGGIPFPSTLCISRNNEIVHGVGSRDIKIEDGDIVSIDIGLWYKGLCTDMAATKPVGGVKKEYIDLVRDTRAALYAGIDVIKPGSMISNIGSAIEDKVNKDYGIVRALVGHGVGHAVHELPHIPNFRTDTFPEVEIKEGMCLAVEPMITLGSHGIKTSSDGWTIVTKDGSYAAHFEVTVAVTVDGYEILTPQVDVGI
ncbi:type I methionyl aminopeptidase [Patescibacteria group bacterium]|nr:type I methionyl aminopeptidase [Patescibacteria group bacterium]